MRCLLDMESWELDFYRCPLLDDSGLPLWELLVCTETGKRLLWERCLAGDASANWLQPRLTALAADTPPIGIRAFRPAAFHLVEPVARTLGVPLRQSRRAIAVQRWRGERERQVYPREAGYRHQPLSPPQSGPVPQGIPDSYLPDRWGFSAFDAAQLDTVHHSPIAFLEVPALESLHGILPGVFLFSSKGSALCRWLAEREPVSLQFTQAELDGVTLETNTSERWILATFQDAEMRVAGRQFSERLAGSEGLHFLAVQLQEDSPQMLGFWLLQTPLL